jgi:hypothetical protein
VTETNEPAGEPTDQRPTDRPAQPQAPGFQPPQPPPSQLPPSQLPPTQLQQPTQPPPVPPTAQYPGPQYPGQQFGAPPQQGYPNPNAPYGGYGQGGYGQYNAYGGGPYGYAQGYYAQAAGTNGMAIASLVLGICGFFCVTPFIGIPLGFVALSKIRQTGQSGRGMAIAGIILSVAWILLLILLIAVGDFHFNVGSTDNGPSVVQTQGPDGTSA